MDVPRPFYFWTTLIGIALFLLWLLRDVLLPFEAAVVLAYLLEPSVSRLEKRGAPRWLAVTFILLATLAILGLLLLIAAPPLTRQLSSFVESLPGYAGKLREVAGDLTAWLNRQLARFQLSGVDLTTAPAPPGQAQAPGWLAAFFQSLVAGGQALLGVFSLFIITPIIAFYLLLDWDRMIAAVDRVLPRGERDNIRKMAREIDAKISAFLRGQALVCLFLGLWYGIGLFLTGLNFGLLIGMLAGLFSFIPYLGSILGFIVAMAIAIGQFWPDFTAIFLVAAVFGTGQFLESYIVTPKIVGEAVGLHPVWMMLALVAFGYLLGFMGLIIAVPLAASIAVVLRHALRVYYESPLYHDREKPHDASE
ncbi:MAG: AI-2E family transporter [Beijerinckiaceae bacterium]